MTSSADARGARIPGTSRVGAGLLPAAFAAGFVALAWLGDELINAGSEFSTYWPASGLLLAVLLLSPPRRWPALGVALLAAELISGMLVGRRLALSGAYWLTDLAEGTLGAWLVLRAAGGRPRLDRARDVLLLAVLAAGVGAGAASLLGSSLLTRIVPERYHDLPVAWAQWWAGDALGILLVAPAILSLVEPRARTRRHPARTAAELAVVVAAAAGAALAVFGLGGGRPRGELGVLLLAAFAWAGVRFGVRGAALSALGVSLFSAWATSHAATRAGGTTVDVQLILGVSGLSALLLAALLEERREALGALTASEERFEAFLAHSPVLLAIKDAEGRILKASRSMEAVHGRPPGGIDGTVPEQLYPPELAARIRQEDRRVVQGEGVRADHPVAGRVFLSETFRIPSATGPLVGAVSVDVTEQRDAERSLRLAQAALETAHGATLFVDPSGCVVFANRAAGVLLGAPPAELLGHSLWELDGAFDEAGWAARWGRLTSGTLVVEGRLHGRDGARVEAEAALTRVDLEGQAWAVYAARDLSDLRRAEAAQRLAAVGTLAAGMAHEINNPLTFVAANLAHALEVLDRPGRPAADELRLALHDAEEGTRRVARVVRDLKAVSRVEDAGRRPLDVGAEVETAVKLAQHELRHRARLEVALGAMPLVESSDFQLGQVFLNLLVNATHALPEGDAEHHLVRVVGSTGPGGEAVVEVADTGCGISPEVRPRIFEPFFTTKPLGQGTGLGLSVCHGIVTSLGGRIEVESEPGRGATFRVVLPAARQAPAAGRESPAAPAPAPGRGRVLVVDDEPLIGITIRRVLATHEVTTVTDAREALALLTSGERFDVVLCDLMMPLMGGIELYQALAARAPEASRRMAFITGGAFTERARDFLERSGRPQITKPFDPPALRALVAGWVALGEVRA
jgi:PAS domain S-box-containing protein